jgi:drug/metabolite transporter (DMT)-like permease
MLTGVLYALAAGISWGLVFVTPTLLPDYPALVQPAARFLAFGLVALSFAWLDRHRLRRLTRADWELALRLAFVGNLLYYFCLVSAVQRTGSAVPTIIIGTLPVVISLCANFRDRRHPGNLPWRRLLPSLGLIAIGIACVNHAELADLDHGPGASTQYWIGVALSVVAVACWTWYPITNAAWLRGHPGRSAQTWATAQGLVTLPLAILAYLLAALVLRWQAPDFPMPLGPRPAVFVGLMATIGLVSTWLGQICWNQASKRLPTALAGQLMVFETLSAMAFTFVLRGAVPPWVSCLGIALVIGGVIWAVRATSGQARRQDRAAAVDTAKAANNRNTAGS